MSQENEYQTLRQEILDDQGREFNIINLSFTATAALIGFGFTASHRDALIFLAPLALLTMTLFQLNNILYYMLAKAVYIRVVIESRNPDLNWEHCIHSRRDILRKKRDASHLIFSVSNYNIITIIVGFLCVLMSYYYADCSYQRIASVVFGSLWAIISIYINRKTQCAVSGDYEKELEADLIKIWAKRLAEREKIKPSPKNSK